MTSITICISCRVQRFKFAAPETKWPLLVASFVNFFFQFKTKKMKIVSVFILRSTKSVKFTLCPKLIAQLGNSAQLWTASRASTWHNLFICDGISSKLTSFARSQSALLEIFWTQLDTTARSAANGRQRKNKRRTPRVPLQFAAQPAVRFQQTQKEKCRAHRGLSISCHFPIQTTQIRQRQ